MTVRNLVEWEEVLDEGLDAVLQVLTSPTVKAHELRQNSPFAGVLSEETRLQVLQAFITHWAQKSQPGTVGGGAAPPC